MSRLGSRFLEGVPLDNCQWKEGVLSSEKLSVGLEMAVLGCPRVGFDIVWEGNSDHIVYNLVKQTKFQVQSNLVISNSLISNYRLSRSENLVPVLT